MTNEHRLERRSRLLAQRMRDASDRLAKQFGEGERKPFTTAMTKSESLAWWRKERHTEAGAKALATMKPWEIAQLDLDLLRAMNPQETD